MPDIPSGTPNARPNASTKGTSTICSWFMELAIHNLIHMLEEDSIVNLRRGDGLGRSEAIEMFTVGSLSFEVWLNIL